MRLIFDPSRVRLYMSPVGSSTKPMTGDLVAVDRGARASAIKVTEPSTPTFQPAVRLNPASAEGVMNMMMMVRGAQLEAKRGRDQIVIPGRPAGDQQRALAIFAANSDPGQDAGRVVGKLRAPGVWRKNWSRLARTSALILAADVSALGTTSAIAGEGDKRGQHRLSALNQAPHDNVFRDEKGELVFPIQTSRRDRRIRQPVERQAARPIGESSIT